MNRTRLKWIIAGVLCVALWPSEILAQTELRDAGDPCAPPDVRNDIRPDPEGPPTEVTVGFFLSDLTDINDVSQSMTIDFLVSLTWTDPRLSHLAGCDLHLDEIWSPDLIVVNSGRLFSSRPRVADIGQNGRARYVQRYYGTLATYHNLKNFPFDDHTFSIQLLSVEWPEDQLVMKVDEERTGVRDELNISDWTIKDIKGLVDRRKSDLSDAYKSRFQFQIFAHRLTSFYLWKIILPICLIVAMSWSVFWINPKQFGPQIGLSATSMLTLIAFIFATTNMVPVLGYFTKLDQLIVGSTILVFLALLQSLTTSYLVSQDKVESAVRFDRASRLGFPLAFVIFTIFVLQS